MTGLAWALGALAAPSRPLYWASIVVNTLTIVAYVITRTVGLLVGPAAHMTESVGFGDLTATAFETVVNLRAAKALGVTIPTAILLRADEVIE